LAFGRVLGRIFVDFCRSGVDFGTPGGSILVPFRGSFVTAGRFARRCDDLLKTCKNHRFLQVFSMFALARTLRKSIENPSERASRASRATDRFRNALFSSLRASKWSPGASRSALRGVLGPSWALLGRSWAALGPLLGGLRALWGALGAFLRRLGMLLRRSWDAPGDPRSVLGDLGSILDPPRVDFRPSGRRFLGLRKLLCEALGGRFCKRLATDLRATRERFAGSTSSLRRSTQERVDPSRPESQAD